MTLERIELFAPSGLRLRADGVAEVETPPRRTGEQPGWIVTQYHVASTADVHGDHWEIHPHGQEVVSVLSGRARLVLRGTAERPDEESITLTAGTACVVPRDRWHRLEIDGPTDLQSITTPAGSRLEARS